MSEFLRSHEVIIPADIKTLFTEGLNGGYAKKAERGTVTRGGIELKFSHYQPDGNHIYHDEWSEAGGQELALVIPNGNLEKSELWTRVYAGRTIDEGLLLSQGLTPKDITTYLRERIKELGEKTRLDQSCRPISHGRLSYEYVVTGIYKELPALTSFEKIKVDGQSAFYHFFVISKQQGK